MLSPKGSMNETEGLEYITQEEEGESARGQDIETVNLRIDQGKVNKQALQHFTGHQDSQIKQLSAIRHT